MFKQVNLWEHYLSLSVPTMAGCIVIFNLVWELRLWVFFHGRCESCVDREILQSVGDITVVLSHLRLSLGCATWLVAILKLITVSYIRHCEVVGSLRRGILRKEDLLLGENTANYVHVIAAQHCTWETLSCCNSNVALSIIRFLISVGGNRFDRMRFSLQFSTNYQFFFCLGFEWACLCGIDLACKIKLWFELLLERKCMCRGISL